MRDGPAGDGALGMNEPRRAPTSAHVVLAIARREIAIAAKRKLVRLLFLGSILPPIVLIVILTVQLTARQMTGFDLGWDPLMWFLRIQAFPVALLALGLGTPSVARDRAEEVLFLYATRPVLPWHYALGKLLAVMIPSAALMVFPGILIAVLRLGITGDISVDEALISVVKLSLAGVLLGWAYAGVTVGPSAATKRARWATLLAILIFFVPDAIENIVFIGRDGFPLGPGNAIGTLLETLFEEGTVRGLVAIFVLVFYGAAGFWITSKRVRQEMIP